MRITTLQTQGIKNVSQEPFYLLVAKQVMVNNCQEYCGLEATKHKYLNTESR